MSSGLSYFGSITVLGSADPPTYPGEAGLIPDRPSGWALVSNRPAEWLEGHLGIVTRFAPEGADAVRGLAWYHNVLDCLEKRGRREAVPLVAEMA